ncbi:U1 small nuclear ribonucleoprotein C-like protein [Carex littledalei]|uniref:U1 small nuclear ribonucleoprotein C n=1 Tax=Carex littledalei TaxID=544730 RepID=A0A833QS60_9POAL|nr:U1 small nuclear ribonucleoprotein C-like protein [Carex littledalei]
MPRYYCDYCDTYLTHDSPSVRKQHNAGYKHKANVRSYYQQFEEQQTQSLIDQRIKEHLGQAAAFQVGAQFNQHLLSLPGGISRPRLPMMPMPMMLGMRPPVLPTPMSGALGYPGGIPTMPPGAMPMGGTSMPMQMTSLPRPPMLPPPVSGPGGAPIPAMNPVMYQPAPPPGSAAPPAPQGGAPPSAS